MSAARTLRVALAGAAAAGVWVAVEPAIRRVTGGRHSQVRLLGGVVAPRGRWREIGLGMHLANGAMFGLAFDRLGLRGPGRGAVAAEIENTLLWPLVGLVDRIHPDVRSGAWPPLATSGSEFTQEVLGHAVFGSVMGALIPRRAR
jgi:hypothetical protein